MAPITVCLVSRSSIVLIGDVFQTRTTCVSGPGLPIQENLLESKRALAGMINGAVVIEMIFGFPGIGKLMIDSIQYRDFAMVQGAVIVTALAIFLLNIMIDLAYAALDPRIKYS